VDISQCESSRFSGCNRQTEQNSFAFGTIREDKLPVMKQLLSIQSAVAAGFVGNSVAGPVLMALDQHPLLVDTILLAAHPGYGKRAGGAVPGPLLADVLSGLAELTDISAIGTVISGYLGGADQVEPVAMFLDGWKRVTEGRYILDPVLGDGGRLYVAPDLARAMVAELLPRADIITPNRFELSFLADTPVDDLAAADAAARTLLARFGLCTVIATGLVDKARGIGDLLVLPDAEASWLPAMRDGRNVAGGGDLLTAVLAGLINAGHDPKAAFETASRTAQTIIARSPGARDLALLENIGEIAALTT